MTKERKFAIRVENADQGTGVLERLCKLEGVRLTYYGEVGQKKRTLRNGLDFHLGGKHDSQTFEDVSSSHYIIEGLVENSNGYQVLSRSLSNMSLPMKVDGREINAEGSLVRYRVA